MKNGMTIKRSYGSGQELNTSISSALHFTGQPQTRRQLPPGPLLRIAWRSALRSESGARITSSRFVEATLSETTAI